MERENLESYLLFTSLDEEDCKIGTFFNPRIILSAVIYKQMWRILNVVLRNVSDPGKYFEIFGLIANLYNFWRRYWKSFCFKNPLTLKKGTRRLLTNFRKIFRKSLQNYPKILHILQRFSKIEMF